MSKFKTINGTLCRMVEPTPLMPDSQFPCVVKLIDDNSAVGRYNRLYNPENISRIFIIDGMDSDYDVTMEIIDNVHYCAPFCTLNIVGYIVTEGSAEWALYKMMKGEKVCNPTLAAEKATRLGYDDVERFNTFWYIVGDAVVEGKANYGALSVSSWISAAHPYGWQIYKEPKEEPHCGSCFLKLEFFDATEKELRSRQQPNPEPTFKVGDWVKYMTLFLQVIEPSGKNRTTCRTPSGTIIYPFTSYLTKLDPSEVVVHIGCLSGTIKKSCDPNYFSMLHPSPDMDRNYSMIKFAALDTETRELVESLLKAQEEG